MAHQQVVEVKAETGRRRAVIDAEKLAQVAKIQYEQKILVKESEKRIVEIDAETYLVKGRALAEVNKNRNDQEGESNKLKLTTQYPQWSMYQALTENTKIYFDESIPKIKGEKINYFTNIYWETKEQEKRTEKIFL